jgi:hypothetical protein
MTYPQPTEPYAPPSPPLPPAKAKFGGLAWTALILGIIGLVGSPIIFLNNATAVVAGVGVVLGIIALFGTKKILAAIGVALGVVGIIVTVVAQNAAVQGFNDALNGATNPSQHATGGSTAPSLAWDKTYTWSDGLAVTVAAPVACTPGQYALPGQVARAVKFTVAITNGARQSFDAMQLTVGGDAQFNGQSVQVVIDSGGPCGDGGMDAATVLPGKSYRYDVAYAVAAQPGDMQLVFQPSFGADKAVFAGRA